jgi:hypothetical protein
VQQETTQHTAAESQAAIKARAEQITRDIGKSKLPILPGPSPSSPPTHIDVPPAPQENVTDPATGNG